MRAFAGPDSEAVFYPRVDGPNSAATESIAGSVAEALGSGEAFDARRGVVGGGGGAVPGDFWPGFPASRDERVNAYFSRELTAYDRLLCFIDASRTEAKKAILGRLGI
jgi:hypothetical protein